MLLHSVDDFVGILQRCRKARDRSRALRLHVYMSKCGLLTHMSLGNYLVVMVADSGSIHDAQHIFDMLVCRSEHAWTSLIAGYVQIGKPEHALAMYEEMRNDSSVHPSAHTFVALLTACTKLGNLERGQELHSKIDELGLSQGDVFIGSTLIDMYAKCGSLLKAQQVFDKLPARNVVCWNALISGYAECGHGEEALKCFQQMHFEGACPDAVTFICSLKACGNVRAIDKGQEIHFEIERQGLLETNLNIGNALLDMYAKCGLPFMAQQVFDKLPVRDVYSWTALIAGYSERGLAAKALHCLDLMKLNGIRPNAVTFICSLKACSSLQTMDKAQELHADIEREGFLERNPVVGNSLIDMYVKCGLLTKAKQVFDKLPVRDVVSWTSLITGYAECGHGKEAVGCFEQMELDGVCSDSALLVCILKACSAIRAVDKGQAIHSEIERQGLLRTNPAIGNTLVDMYAKFGLIVKAQQVFDSLPVRNLVSWNALMAGYAEHGLGEETVKCFERMQFEGVSPDAVTFVCSLKACGSLGATGKGEEIHAEIERQGLLEQDQLVGSTLVDMYSRCGSPVKAQEVLDKLPVRDVVSWTALMEGYAQCGESESVFGVFDRMLSEHITPDPVTFIVILSMCSQKGLFVKSHTYFEAMSNSFGIAPTLEHHNCVLDLLLRGGHLEKAAKMIEKLPFTPNLVAWRTMLSACSKWGNSEYAKHAFKHVMHLKQKDPLCMSHIIYQVLSLERAEVKRF